MCSLFLQLISHKDTLFPPVLNGYFGSEECRSITSLQPQGLFQSILYLHPFRVFKHEGYSWNARCYREKGMKGLNICYAHWIQWWNLHCRGAKLHRSTPQSPEGTNKLQIVRSPWAGKIKVDKRKEVTSRRTGDKLAQCLLILTPRNRKLQVKSSDEKFRHIKHPKQVTFYVQPEACSTTDVY